MTNPLPARWPPAPPSASPANGSGRPDGPRPPTGSTAAAGRRPTRVVGGDQLVELALAGGEAVVPVPSGPQDVEEVVHLGGMRGGLDGGEARVADRSRGEAGVDTGVVRRGRLE